jgi:hypothetical protein
VGKLAHNVLNQRRDYLSSIVAKALEEIDSTPKMGDQKFGDSNSSLVHG